MLQRDGLRQRLPARLRPDPVADGAFQLRLQQIEMARVADLQVPAARHGGIRFDQVGRVQQAAAVVALVAPRADVAAVRTGALDVAVGQEAGVVDGVDHAIHPLLDEAVRLQHVGEMLGQAAVGFVRTAAEPVVAESEGLARPLLDLVLLVAVGADVLTGRGGGQFGRGAVLVGGADVEDVVPLGPFEPAPHVGRQHRARQVPEVLDAVDVGQRRGDEDAGHGSPVSRGGVGYRGVDLRRHAVGASRRAMRTKRPVRSVAETRLATMTAQTRPSTPKRGASHQPSGIMIAP